MTNGTDLERAKEKIRQRIIGDTAGGINGVALDRRRSKLLVFFTDESAALDLLRKDFGEQFLESVELHSGKESQADDEPSGRRLAWLRSTIRRLVRFLFKFSIRPTSVVRQIPNTVLAGRVGCFVSLDDPDVQVAAMTAGHIFTDQDGSPGRIHDMQLEHDDDEFTSIGWSWRFASARGGGDCALFRLDLAKVALKKKSFMTGDYLMDPSEAESHWVRNLVGESAKGCVVDAKAVIKCSPAGRRTAPLLDGQILIEGCGFGVKGHSGSPVVMDEKKAGIFNRGDVLGIYTYICDDNRFHWLLSLESCFCAFPDAQGIYDP